MDATHAPPPDDCSKSCSSLHHASIRFASQIILVAAERRRSSTRAITVRSVLRPQPDYERLAQAVLHMARREVMARRKHKGAFPPD